MVKENGKRIIMGNSEYAIYKVVVPLPVSVAYIQAGCRPYVLFFMRGWTIWIRNMVRDSQVRRKRDLVAKVIGGVGTGLGISNTINAESLATKISNLGHDIHNLDHPLKSSFGKISTLEY